MSACEKCDGKGTIGYRTLGDIEPRPFGEGTTIQNMGGWSTRPCECVKDLPPIHGIASWWDMETIYGEVVSVPIGNECVEVSADCEVPRAKTGRRLHRTLENVYYPPLIRVEVPGHLTLHADTARELATSLVAAADACDAADAVTAAFDESEA